MKMREAASQKGACAPRNSRCSSLLALHPHQTMSARLRICRDRNTASAAVDIDLDSQVRWGQLASGFFRPFDEAYGFAVEIFAQARIDPFVRACESIKIKVIQV